MFKSKGKVTILVLLIFSAAINSVWAIRSPTVYLQTVANRLVRQLEKNRNRLSNARVTRGIVRRVVLPEFYQSYVAQSVVGRRYWRSSTSRQKREFIRLFASMIINTYSNSLQGFNGDIIKVLPVLGDYKRSQFLQVKSILTRRNGRQVHFTYFVLRRGQRWKVYDFSVEGVSMVQSSRAQFASVLSSQGMTGLLRRLRDSQQ